MVRVALDAGSGKDGNAPFAGVIGDGSGNLYGTTFGGGIAGGCKKLGDFGCGTVFRLAPDGKESQLFVFSRKMRAIHGNQPTTGLLLKNGKLYGTAEYGGTANDGVVFELKK